MKPGILKWATNNNFAGGPDVGSATKVPPTSGQEADGYYRNNKPAAQIWNYERWAIFEKLKRLDAMWIKNWQEASNEITTPPHPRHGIYDPANNTHFIVNTDGATGREVSSVLGGRYLVETAATGFPNMNAVDHFETGSNDVRVICGPANDQLYYSSALGAWALWTGVGALGVTFYRGHYDNISRYCFLLDTSCDIYSTTSTGTVPSSVDTAFAAATPCKMLHSRHPAAFLYPNDPGNQLWMAVTSTETNTSSNGTTWGTPVTHGVSGIDKLADMAYSAFGSRWIIATRGVTGGLGQIAISDDNGATWTAYNRIPYNQLSTVTKIQIESDGFGNWVVIATDGSNNLDVSCSVDNGETWQNVFLPFDNQVQTSNYACLWYGDGQFNIAVEDVVTNNLRQFHSLTIES